MNRASGKVWEFRGCGGPAVMEPQDFDLIMVLRVGGFRRGCDCFKFVTMLRGSVWINGEIRSRILDVLLRGGEEGKSEERKKIRSWMPDVMSVILWRA